MSIELSPLLGTPDAKPNKLHYLAVFSVTLAKFGDSVEFVIPTVITQPVSCELGLSERQEQLLALVLYRHIDRECVKVYRAQLKC